MSDVNTNGGALGDPLGSGNTENAQHTGNDHGDPNQPAPGGSQQAGNTGSGAADGSGGPA